MWTSAAFLASFLTVTFANPIAQPYPIHERGTPTIKEVSAVQETVSLCTQYAYYAANGYEVLNNLWGKDKATSGSQCTYYDGAADNGIKWSTEWTWNGGENDVKSYAYAGRQLTKGNLVSKVKSMPTVINWSYNITSHRCNVAYDVFTASDPNHVNSSGDYELMIWLNRYGGVWPITQSGSPIASVTIAGYKFDLYFGYNGSMKVYSFVTSGGAYNSFSADIKLFFDYLTQNQSYPASTQNLIVYQIGTEAFTGGPAKFSVSKFSANVNM